MEIVEKYIYLKVDSNKLKEELESNGFVGLIIGAVFSVPGGKGEDHGEILDQR